MVTNAGSVPGKEVVQLYMEPLNCGGKASKEEEQTEKPVYRPKRELKGFAKVSLQPGESKTMEFTLDDRSFAVWQQGWKVPEGSYRICIGKDAHHMILAETLDDVSSVLPGYEAMINPTCLSENVPEWYQNPTGAPLQETFETLLGRKIIQKPLRKGEFTKENTVMEMKEYSLVMKLLYKILEIMMAREFGGKADYNNPTFRMMVTTATDCSISGMKINGKMNNYVLEGLLEMANGHWMKGIGFILGRKR